MTVSDYFLANHQALVRWHPERNGTLSPAAVSCGSHKRAWFRCDRGHEWEALIVSVLLDGCGCPYCTGKKALPGFNDLATQFPEVALEWDPDRNGGRSPDAVLPSSHDRVWWQCSRGHSWQAVIFSRTTGRPSGCPYCTGRKVLPGFNDLAALKPKVAQEWHPTLNDTLRPTQVTPGSNKKVWWQCADGHVWQAAIYSRTRAKAADCPVCAGIGKRKKSPM